MIVLVVIGYFVFLGRDLAEDASKYDGQTLVLIEEVGTTWQPWSEDAVGRALASGHPVFVDFTASWCLSCQVNERVALTRPEVMQAFKEHNVILLKADWTREDEAITHALEGLGRNGVPTYVLYSPGQSNPELLPEVLTPGIVTDALAKLPKAATQENAAASNRE
jgi:thiol:disulfide interchange protein DsbD